MAMSEQVKLQKGDIVKEKGSPSELVVVSVRKDRIRCRYLRGITAYYSDDYGVFVYKRERLEFIRRRT